MPAAEYSTKLGRFFYPGLWPFLWLVFGLVPLYFFQTLFHESMHFFTALAHGDHPTLVPYPHFDTGFGHDLNGVTLNAGGFPSTPQFVDFVVIAIPILIFVFTSPATSWLRVLVTAWYIGLVVDLLYNTAAGGFGIFHDGTDWTKFAGVTSKGVAGLFSWIFLLGALSQLVWIWPSKWNDSRPNDPGFFEYRILAIIYAVFALLAVIVSLAVTDPSVVRDGLYWGFLIAEIICLAWYIAYVIWASVQSS